MKPLTMGIQDENISSQKKYLANEYVSYFIVKSGSLNQAYLAQHTRVDRINKIGGHAPKILRYSQTGTPPPCLALTSSD
jgi:hypothetical protein